MSPPRQFPIFSPASIAAVAAVASVAAVAAVASVATTVASAVEVSPITEAAAPVVVVTATWGGGRPWASATGRPWTYGFWEKQNEAIWEI